MSSEGIEQFYRDATAADVLRVMNGEEVEARFSENARAFFNSSIAGWRRFRSDYAVWVDKDGSGWQFCQVYDPPQWFREKPEPGEGYRLLGKFPDEPVLAGDFIKDVDGAWRELVSPCNPVQGMTCWYRRRIEQPLLPGHQWLSPGDRLACGDSYYHEGAVQEVDQVYWGNLIHLENAFMRKVDPPKPEPKHYKLNAWDTADLPSGHRIIVTEHGIEVQ